MANAKEFTRQLRAAVRFAASYLKSEWTIRDYPIDYRYQQPSEAPGALRWKSSAWIASVVNWPVMSGCGATKAEALEDLRQSLDRFKAAKRKLPRPGSRVAIEFAATSRVQQHGQLADDFVRRVIGVKWAWISDQSTLWDFHGEETNESLIERIRGIYGVDVSDIRSGNLADILDRIAVEQMKQRN